MKALERYLVELYTLSYSLYYLDKDFFGDKLFLKSKSALSLVLAVLLVHERPEIRGGYSIQLQNVPLRCIISMSKRVFHSP